MNKGQTVGILGPNGAGKTTLFISLQAYLNVMKKIHWLMRNKS